MFAKSKKTKPQDKISANLAPQKPKKSNKQKKPKEKFRVKLNRFKLKTRHYFRGVVKEYSRTKFPNNKKTIRYFNYIIGFIIAFAIFFVAVDLFFLLIHYIIGLINGTGGGGGGSGLPGS